MSRSAMMGVPGYWNMSCRRSKVASQFLWPLKASSFRLKSHNRLEQNLVSPKWMRRGRSKARWRKKFYPRHGVASPQNRIVLLYFNAWRLQVSGSYSHCPHLFPASPTEGTNRDLINSPVLCQAWENMWKTKIPSMMLRMLRKCRLLTLPGNVTPDSWCFSARLSVFDWQFQVLFGSLEDNGDLIGRCVSLVLCDQLPHTIQV